MTSIKTEPPNVEVLFFWHIYSIIMHKAMAFGLKTLFNMPEFFNFGILVKLTERFLRFDIYSQKQLVNILCYI